ncbi:MAG: STAS domain-containing protein [bacterium]
MALHFQDRDREGIAVVDLQGRLVMGRADAALRDHLESLISSGKTNLILNLENVTQVDSPGLGTLAFTQAKLKRAGGKLVLLHLRQAHAELLVYVKLGAVFEVFTHEQDAINSFFPDRTINRFDILSFVQSMKRPSGSGRHEPTPLVDARAASSADLK